MADTTLRWAINIAEWQPSEQRMEQLLTLLSPVEQQQVQNYVHLNDKKRSLVSRLMQRACASMVLGVPWRTIDIQRTAGNRPYIANNVHRPNAPNFNYNVSHEGNWVVLASEPRCAVGCDVSAPRGLSRAAQRPLGEWLESFKAQLTAEEWEMVQAAGPDDDDKERVFRQFWCLKEAFVKARGDGLAFDLSKAGFTITGNTKGQQLNATLMLDGLPQPQWRFIIQHLPQDHWVAVCRAPPGAVVDSHGGFLATFQYPHMSPQELQNALLARSPVFEELSVSDILPDNLIIATMFKKPVAVSSNRLLSGKDIKYVKSTLNKLYAPYLTEDDLASLLPSKSEVTATKLSTKAIVYSVNGGNPLLFDPNGRGEYILPTVYALWLVPHMLQPIATHSSVSSKVLGGADLFLQGVIVPPGGLPPLARGSLVSITVPTNRYPFAIGTMHVSTSEAASAGYKGKGVELVHVLGDGLWAMGDKVMPHASVTLQCVSPIQGDVLGEAGLLGEGGENEGGQHEGGQDEGGQREGGQREGGQHVMEGAVGIEKLMIGGEQGDGGAHGAAHRDSTATAAGTAATAASTRTTEAPSSNVPGPADMDAILETTLLRALVAVPDDVLPILPSDLYARYMLPNRPAGATLDVKKSSYKKLSKLLTTYEKKGALKLKKIRTEEYISHVHRACPLLVSVAVETQGEITQGAVDAAQEAEEAARLATRKVHIQYVYRIPSTLRPLVTPTHPKDTLLTPDEVVHVVREYAQRHQLLQGENQVKLDAFLASSLFKKGEGVMLDDVKPVHLLAQRAVDKFTKYHHVSRTTATGALVEVVKAGDIKPIRITTKDRQGGRKHITSIIGLEGFSLDPEEVAGLVQKRFAVASTTSTLPGNNNPGKEVLAQGALAAKMAAFLTEEFGVAGKHIVVVGK